MEVFTFTIHTETIQHDVKCYVVVTYSVITNLLFRSFTCEQKARRKSPHLSFFAVQASTMNFKKSKLWTTFLKIAIYGAFSVAWFSFIYTGGFTVQNYRIT